MIKVNRIILVTGASRGLGTKIAETFLENNDTVYVNYNHSKKEAEELCSKYEKAIPIKCDVASELEVEAMIKRIDEEQGHLDVIVNNAGIALDSLVDDKTKETFQTILDTNLIGPFLVCKYGKELWKKEVSLIFLRQTESILIIHTVLIMMRPKQALFP